MEFNNKPKNIVPINRNNLFYSEESFQFDTEMGMDYLSQDVNQTVVLYEVDLEKTNLDSVYGESKSSSVFYKTPIELHVIYEIDEAELKSYDKTKNLGTYMKTGKLSFGVFQYTLDALGANIKIGDYIGVQVTPSHMEYFVVVDDGRNNYSNSVTTYGYKPAYRLITASQVNENEFNG